MQMRYVKCARVFPIQNTDDYPIAAKGNRAPKGNAITGCPHEDSQNRGIVRICIGIDVILISVPVKD